MKAIVCSDFNNSAVETVPRPDPAPDEVLVAVSRVQLSVTECKLYRGDQTAHYETIRDRLENDDGRLFGHEFCGRVVECGDDVESFRTGDRVYAPGKLPCTDCQFCNRGHAHLCSDKRGIGWDMPGALAEYVSLPSSLLVGLPSDVSDREGAAMQPLASAYLCMMDAKISPGDEVAVIGTGVMGYQCGQLAKLFGAKRVFAVDIRSEPLEYAEKRGMIPVDGTKVDAPKYIRDELDGVGADVVVEAAGGNQTDGSSGNGPFAQALKTVRRGGKIVQVGHIVGDMTLRPRALRSKYVTWINPRKGVVFTSPNASTGELAPEMVADDSVSITEFIPNEQFGFESFDRVVDMTLNKGKHGILGPVQIAVNHE